VHESLVSATFHGATHGNPDSASSRQEVRFGERGTLLLGFLAVMASISHVTLANQLRPERVSIEKQCAQFDTEVEQDMTVRGGPNYASLGGLTFRVALAGKKLIADVDGKLLFFPQENFSDGTIGTPNVRLGQAGDIPDRYWPLLTRWPQYLRGEGFDPKMQVCTDDFAEPMVHNTNLSLKGIEGLAISFRARPVAGGSFVRVLCDPVLWNKWASRASQS
jgi:hypothetical protein